MEEKNDAVIDTPETEEEQQEEEHQESPIPESKPRRVLTEAQRLAFIKGREKRMANIEKKKQEKEAIHKEEHEDFAAKIADMVLSKIKTEPVPEKPKLVKRKYTRRIPESPEEEPVAPPPPPPQKVFNWM
jgi:hypothetical protein